MPTGFLSFFFYFPLRRGRHVYGASLSRSQDAQKLNKALSGEADMCTHKKDHGQFQLVMGVVYVDPGGRPHEPSQ